MQLNTWYSRYCILKKYLRKRLFPSRKLSQKRIRAFLKRYRHTQLIARPLQTTSLGVVMPCYKHAQYLGAAIESLMRQTRQPEEIIFIDDASPDNTRLLLENNIAVYQQQCPRTKFLLLHNERNAGQTASLNKGILAVDSDVVMILNDDDYLMHDAVEAILTLFNCYLDVYMIGAHSIHFDDERTLSAADKYISTLSDFHDINMTIHSPRNVRRYRHINDLNMTHSGSAFFKVAWQVVGGYWIDKESRLVRYSDRDFQLRINALFPVAVSYKIPFSFWRSNSSVDNRLFS